MFTELLCVLHVSCFQVTHGQSSGRAPPLGEGEGGPGEGEGVGVGVGEGGLPASAQYLSISMVVQPAVVRLAPCVCTHPIHCATDALCADPQFAGREVAQELPFGDLATE